MLIASVGVCAYNEERNLGPCLESIRLQTLSAADLVEVLVISSGSTDGTDEIARHYAKTDSRFRLIRQEKREGKNSAINEFLHQAKGQVFVLVNADNRLEPGALEALLAPFDDASVGVVGGHPVPVNDASDLAGFAVRMLWDMHHRVALIHPKVGELVAFRAPGIELPMATQSDEDLIRLESEKRGLRTVYAPEARVRNKGPTTVGDFWKQRTRVNIGERYLKRWHRYQVPTWDVGLLLVAYGGFLRDNWRHPLLVFGAMALEGAARVYASLYVAMDRGDRAVWSQVSSTKDLQK